MSTAKLYCGHVLDVLKRFPDESVRCVVTSPPYWGLRCYRTADQVFGGDPQCEHEWGEEGVRVRGGGNGGGAATVGRDQSARASRVPIGTFCVHCGAWRGQLGLEPTPDLYIEHMVMVFREVRRVLAKDGTLWLNMGDCYATGAGRVGEHPGGGEQGARWKGDVNRLRDAKRGYRGDRLVNTNSGDIARPKTRKFATNTIDPKSKRGIGPMTQPNRMPLPGLKPKDLVLMPARLALALQADGWWIRSDIIFSKPNPMPESVKDRPTRSHEYVFLLAKSERYYYDAQAIAEPLTTGDRRPPHGPGQEGIGGRPASGTRGKWKTPDGWDTSSGEGGHGSFHKKGREKGRRRSGNKQRDIPSADDGRGIPNDHRGRGVPWEDNGTGRNARSVWTIPSQPYKGAHFACVDQETEVLTREGWRRHHNVRDGDEIAAFDGHVLTWEPARFARYSYDGEMVAVTSRDLSMWLTPNHRVVRRGYRRPSDPWTVRRADELRSGDQIPTAAALLRGDWLYPVRGDWLYPASPTSLAVAELCGWVLTDGSYNDGRTITIYQSEGRGKTEIIESLLADAKVSYRTYRRVRTHRPEVAYTFGGELAAYMRFAFPRKEPSYAVLHGWEGNALVALWRGMVEGDGNRRRDGRVTFVGDRRKVDFFQALCAVLGKTCRLTHRGARTWAAYVSHKNATTLRGTGGRGASIATVHYRGVVWCPSVAGGMWLARRQGKPFITGNTFPEELARRCILAGSAPGDTILDPFGGSGTVAQVATGNARNAIYIDLNPEYLDLARHRIGPMLCQVVEAI